jgi:hypothetical protein
MNTKRQIIAMLQKNWMVKRRTPGQLIWEILLPCLIILYLRWLL